MAMAELAKEANEGPILFRPELVRATLDDVKTQTRRTRGLNEINAEPDAWQFCDFNGLGNAVFTKDHIDYKEIRNPFGWEGDRLWVRETWRERGSAQREDGKLGVGPSFYRDCLYRADGHEYDGPWRPSIFMPRVACRLILEITEMRVQRVQDITDEDARAEGVDYMPSMPAATSHRTSFARGWDVINGKKGLGWKVNPWLWCITYRKAPDGRA